jgi:ATP-binding cassette subfamily F protein 3
MRRGMAVGYLPQENPPLEGGKIIDEALAHHADPDGKITAKAKSVLMGLGFKVTDFERDVSTLSGGWAMRVAMARLLLQEPDLLMLDEPTNHLDLESLFWFQEYLQYYPGAIFLISHDRAFINALCQGIVSVQDKTLKVYTGNYDAYLSERASERERLESAYRRQQEEIAEMQDFISRNRARASTASRAQSMMKRLEKLERIELPEEARTLKIRFPQPERTGVRAMVLKNVHKSYGDIKVYQGLDLELERGWKIAFVGKNGAGKSTLLKLLAGVLPFESGERTLGMNVKVGYFSQHRAESLDPNKTVLQEAMESGRDQPDQMVRTVLGSFLFPGQAVFKKTSVLSGGEKSRLALVKLLLDPPNVLLMDEPTTHLDMASVDALIEALKGFEGTLGFISHDLYFINALADHVLHVEHGKVTFYPGNYEYFQHRQARQAEEAADAAPFADAPPPPPPPVPRPVGKNPAEERRRRAQEREQARQKEKEKDKVRLSIAEDRQKIDALSKELEDPQVYGNFERVQEIGKEVAELQAGIARKEAELGPAV